MNQFASFNDLLLVSPIMILLISGAVLMLMDAFKMRGALSWVAGIGMLASLVISHPPILHMIATPAENGTAFNGMIRVDELSQIIHVFLTLSGFFTLFFIGDYMKRAVAKIYDIYALITFSVIGMSMLANANDLIITFIGLETMSICLYIMAAMYKKDGRSNEAGLKYFLLGAFATGFFLYGIALIYGGTGSTNFEMINNNLAQLASGAPALFYAGIGMILIGFLFKVSAFPFHSWTPDVYSGTPTPLAGFMATGSKAAAFIALAVFMGMNPVIFADAKIQTIVIVVAILTMAFGNIVAARQNNLKRMLAYSSIAHSGYVLLAVCAGGAGVNAAIFYMLIYTLMNIGAFGLIGMAENSFEDTSYDSWKGFGRKNPWQGVALSIFLFSLAGIPPLAGFMGKYFVFAVAIQNGLVIPAIIGILTSVVGAFYYINIVKVMYFDESAEPKVISSKNLAPVVGVAVLVVLILLFGVFPSLVQEFVQKGVTASLILN